LARKIDDELLLDMISRGKEQKEAAAYFHVSPAAVCKRLKRLSRPSPEDVLDKYNLTDKQKSFCIEKAKGKTNTQAALAVYATNSTQTAKSIGSELMQRAEIRESIEALLDSEGVTKRYRVKRVKYLIDHKDPAIVCSPLCQYR
jgi:predicted transcriptional regulator